MNSKQRFKLGAGAGLVTMLLGALLMLAPGAGADSASGNEDCSSLAPGSLLAKYEPGESFSPPESGLTATGDFNVTFDVEAIDGGGLRFSFYDAGEPVRLVFVKQASEKQGLSEAFIFEPPVKSGVVNYTKDSGFSHITFCSGEFTTTTTEATTTTTEATTTTTEATTTTTEATTTTTETTPTTAPAETTTTAVQGNEVTTTTVAGTTATTAAPTTAATAEVQGDVVTRTLPRTGNENRNLAGLGAIMVALGAALVVGSSRRQANIG